MTQVVGAVTALVRGVDAENQLLEDVAPPLALVAAADGAGRHRRR